MDIFSSGERERLGGRGRGRLGGRGQGRVSGGRSIGGSGAMNMKQQGSDHSSSFSQGSTSVPFGNSSGYVGQNTKPHKTPPRQTFGKIQPPSVPLEYSPPQGWGELGSSPFQSLTRSSDMSTQSQQSRWAESSGSEQGYSHMFSTSTSSRGDGGNGWPRGYRDGKDQEVGRGRGRGRGRDTSRPPPYSTTGSFSCRVCNASFESKTSLVLHLKEKQHFNTASSDQSGGESDTKGPFSRQDSGDSGSSWGGRGQGDNGGRGKPGPRRTYSCRVCNTVFDSNSALYAHLKSEGHFNTSSQPPAIGNQVNADDSDGQMHYGLPPRHSNSHVPAKSEKHVHSTENRHLRENAVLQPAEGTPAFGGGKSFGSGALQPAEGTPAFGGGKSFGSGALQPAEGIPALARAQTRLGNKDSISSSSLAGSVKNSWRNTIGLANVSGKNRDETTDDSPSNSSKFSSYSTATNVPVPSGGLQNDRARQMTTPSPVVPLELHADGQIVGTCEDMCPREEIVKRVRQSDVHLFEQPLEFDERLEAGTVLEDEFVNTLHRTMIKQLQKSSADHTLAIPHLVRTPRALLRTIDYMDENVMSLDLEVKEDEDPARGPIALDVYHFVWNRYRMIAKDFILQNYRFGGRLDAFCVECHERMTRWHIMMDHQMLWSEYYVKQDAYQHQEQLNKLLKTLNELYDEASNRRQMKFENPDTAVDTVDVPNEGEFRSYYILYQLDNEGEVEKYIQTIGEEVLAHPSIQFALKVVRARRVGNYAAFFRLLRTSNFLQACALFKYVGFMRMEALKVMNRVLRSGKQEVNFPISDLVRMLMFEDESDAADFTEQCGLEVMESPENDGESQIIFNGRIDCSSVPTTRQMERGIAERVSHLSRAEVSQGLASGAVLFNAGSSSSSDSSTPPFQCARSNVSKPQTPQRTSSKLLPSRTQVSPTRVPSPGSPRGEIAESLLTKKKSGSSLSSISNDGSQGSMEKTSNLSSTVSSSAFGSFGVSSKRQPVPSNSLTSQPPLVDRGGLGNVSFGETSKKGVSDKSTVLGFTNPLAATQLEKSTPVVGVSAPATVEIPKENLRARRMREKAEAEQALLKQKEANMILEQQRIDKEKIDAERREMDRVRRAAEEKAVRQAAVEKEREARRDRELGVLTERCIQRKKKWTLLRVMQHWRKRTQDMVERNARNTLKLMFHLWLKVYERVLERRERLNEQLLSIQAVPNLAHCVDKVGVKRIRLNYKRARESFSFDPSGVVFGGSCIPLYDSARALMSGYAGKWGTRGIAPAVAGDLFIVQCNRMRSLLGRSMIETTTDLGTGPLWEHDLFFKLSILTPTHTTAQWDHSFCLLPNMLRAILCDPEKSVDSECPERISYSTSQEVCGYIGKRPIRRSVHVVVMDGCSGRGGKGIFPRTPVLATLASIVVLPDVTMSVMQAGFNRRCFSEILYDDSIELNVRKYFEDLTASCVELVRKGVPIVIILTREIVRSSQSSAEEEQPRNSANHSYNHEQGPHRSCTNRISTWREISPGDEACDIVSLFIQSIADVSNREVNVQKAYLIEMEMENDDLPVRLSGKGKNNDELFGYTKRGCPLAYALEACQECVLASVQALAGSVAPLPLVQRVGVCDWAEEAVTNAIWSDNEYFSGSDNMRQELDVDDGIEGYVSDTEAKSSGRTVGRRRMRKQECKEMPHFSTSVAQCLERITMCIDACESRIHHTLSILSTSRKRDAHYSIFPLVDFSEGGFVKGSLYENMSGLCTEAEVNSLPVDWTDVNRLKDALSLLSKFRLPQWQTVGSVEVQCEHFCNALNTRGWVVPGGLNGLLSKVVGDNSSKVTASDCKRRRSDSTTLRRISGGESNARFSLLRRWLTILYQRRARDLSSSLRSDRSSYSGQMYLLYPPVDRTSMQVILSDSEIPEDNYPGIKPKRAYSGLHALASRTAINCNSPIISRKPVEINCQSNSAVNDFWETTFVRSDCECIVTEDHTVVTHKRTRMEMDAPECEIVNPLPRAGISILDTSYPECQEKIVASKASQLRADCNEEKRRCAELENTLREDLRRGDLGYTDVLTELRGCVPAYTDVCKIADERLW
eukprot:CAMPEP_0185042380 /NCGR_PEP_ID=MMETSP1103-20130426/42318_1 /TAXON_ID=36769 /ORGANISM="Paraphysomonas bandaiensis, Strain Caron Lab Isolate" /LENGTH=2072 /DNA_ID=CAMNT_0027582443 /DNA_START=109 /DNA_END=6324 /DNA_ORIENTATION=+